MFCPKCATKNLDGASYCRVCGANISLVPQALSGQLPVESPSGVTTGRHGRRRREATLDQAFKSIFMGIAFLVISIALSRSIGRGWWFWMLIPAFSMLASGVAQYVRLREKERTSLLAQPMVQQQIQSPSVDVFSARNTGELIAPPPSVTEGTTRHLGSDAATKQLNQDQK